MWTLAIQDTIGFFLNVTVLFFLGLLTNDPVETETVIPHLDEAMTSQMMCEDIPNTQSHQC